MKICSSSWEAPCRFLSLLPILLFPPSPFVFSPSSDLSVTLFPVTFHFLHSFSHFSLIPPLLFVFSFPRVSSPSFLFSLPLFSHFLPLFHLLIFPHLLIFCFFTLLFLLLPASLFSFFHLFPLFLYLSHLLFPFYHLINFIFLQLFLYIVLLSCHLFLSLFS